MPILSGFFLRGYIREVDDILQLWWQGGRRQTLGMSELLQSWSCSAALQSCFKPSVRNIDCVFFLIPVLADNLQSISPPEEGCLVQLILGGVHRKEAISVR